MVFTRNQKRKIEDEIIDDDNLDKCNSSGTFIVKNSGNFNLSIKRKKITHCEKQIQTETEKETETTESEIETESETESEIETESENKTTESETSENETSENKSVEEPNVVQNLENVIKKSLTNLLTRFTKKDKIKKNEDEYDKYINCIDSIYDGDFFERVSIDDKKKKLKEKYSEEEIQKINQELRDIKNNYNKNVPNVVDILKMDIDISQKQKLLEKMYHFINSDLLTIDYNSNLKFLISNINQDENSELVELEKKILEKSNSVEYSDNYRKKILKSKMPFENKIIAYKRLEVMESFESTDTSEYAKYKSWMDILLSIPYDELVNNRVPCITEANLDNAPNINDNHNFIKNVRNVLDLRLSFLETAKDQVLNIVTQMIRNPDFTINAIGLYGEKGVGKTAFVKSISEALGRPYRTISLGGESDSSLLTGHGFTYVGSGPGRIIEILRETKCTNPIILFDELDKVSETYRGKEIIGNLIHLTDSTSNNKYNYDKYFAGLEFDLSKVLFVFTYNDETKVDPILADRLFKIRVNNYSVKEKLEIAKTHLIKTILKQYSFTENEIVFEDDAIHYIVESSRSDQGMRDVKRKFEIVISRVNTLLLTDPKEDIIRLKYKKLYNYYKNTASPIKILKDHVDVFLSESITNDDKNNGPPPGMYM